MAQPWQSGTRSQQQQVIESGFASNATCILCAGATAADALSAGYRTILIEDCCRGVDLKDIEHTNNTLLENHGVIIQSREVFITSTLYRPFAPICGLT